jgi:putative transposase
MKKRLERKLMPIQMRCFGNWRPRVASPSTVFSLHLDGWDLSVKKTLRYSESLRQLKRTQHFLKRRYALLQANYLPVYVDETGFAPKSHRPYARALKGQKIIGYRAAEQRPRTSLLGAYRQHQLIAPMLFEGTCNTSLFNQWLQQFLIPELTQPSLIILDNATFHRARSTWQILHQAGHRLLYLPPYSPHLNPIEKLWANIKRVRQSHPNKSIDQIINAFF